MQSWLWPDLLCILLVTLEQCNYNTSRSKQYMIPSVALYLFNVPQFLLISLSLLLQTYICIAFLVFHVSYITNYLILCSFISALLCKFISQIYSSLLIIVMLPLKSHQIQFNMSRIMLNLTVAKFSYFPPISSWPYNVPSGTTLLFQQCIQMTGKNSISVESFGATFLSCPDSPYLCPLAALV